MSCCAATSALAASVAQGRATTTRGARRSASGRRTVCRAQAAATQTSLKGVALSTIVKGGVVSGKDSMTVLQHARDNGYAIPAVNCTNSNNINACLEAAAKARAPIMVQFSNGGGQFMAGKSLPNDKQQASVAGAVAGALHTRHMAALYGVPVFLHTDHCSKKLLPWFDGLLEANEAYYAENGYPLFSSHMLDLSEEPIEENLEICARYLERMAKIDCVLEMELGVTGGEEDGVDNTNVNKEDLYSKPTEIDQVYEALMPISSGFTVAAAFGNVHGVYKPGNVELTPTILGDAQKYIREKRGASVGDKPVYFVFHGGSGSSREEIREAIGYGTVKMNIDTDTQWAAWDGVHQYYLSKKDYLQKQIGNPDGDDSPNKKHYDPRVWMRASEVAVADRLAQAFEDLNATNACGEA